MKPGRYPLLATILAGCAMFVPGAAGAVASVTGPPAAPHTFRVPGRLSSMSCATPSVCFAINNADKLTRWGVTRLTRKGASSHTRLVSRTLTLVSLSCPDAHGCAALAERDRDFAFRVLPVGLHGTIGKPRRLGAPSTVPLAAIACHPSRAHCTMVGGANQTVHVVTLNGVTAGTHDVTLPSGVSGVALTSLACPTKVQCYAAGVATVNGKPHGLVVPIRDGKPAHPIYLASASTIGLLGIACTTVKRCYAIGFGHRAYVYTLRSGKLIHSVAAPRSVVLFGIACHSGHLCDAVGSQTAVKGVILPLHNGNLSRLQVTSVTPTYGSTRTDGEQGPIAGFPGGVEIAGVDATKQFDTVISSS